MQENKNYTHPNTHGQVIRVSAPKEKTKKEDSELTKRAKHIHYDLHHTANYLFLNDNFDNQSTFCLGFNYGYIEAKKEGLKFLEEIEDLRKELKLVREQRDAIRDERDRGEIIEPNY